MVKGTEEMSNAQLLEEIKKQEEIIKHYEDALGEIGDLVTDSSKEQIAAKILSIESEASKKVGVIRTGNPFYGQIIRVREDLDHGELEKIGYEFHIMEAGYISPDQATIVMTHRSGQVRKVVQYRPDVMNKHVRNVQELINLEMIEELN